MAVDASKLENDMIQAALSDDKIFVAGFDSSRVFAIISVLLRAPSASIQRAQLIKSIATTYLFIISRNSLNAADLGETATWFVDMKKKGRLQKLEEGEKMRADVTIRCSDSDLVGLATGQLNPQKLFAAKRIKVRGDIDRALKVERILTQERKKLEKFAAAKVKGEGRWQEMGKGRAKL